MNTPFFIFLSIVILLIFFVRWIIRYSRTQQDKLESVRQLYKNSDVFLCFSMEQVQDGVLQLYGESTKTAMKPGICLRSPWGNNHIIQEVFADDDTPDIPDAIVEAGVPDTPVVVPENGWNSDTFEKILSEQGVVVFHISHV